MSRLVKFFSVLAIAFLAYGQTIFMYFWQDDSALIFKLQHLNGPAGSFGSGIVGEGPYKWLVSFFVPFFKFFGLNPFWYFLVGFLSYLAVIFVFYLFVRELYDKNSFPYISTLIFSSGYIGSEIMFRIINSWQTNIGLILALMSFLFFVKFLRNLSSPIYYVLALALFYLATELVYVRSHSLIFPILILDIVLTQIPTNYKKIFHLLVRQLPFFFLFYVYYLVGVPQETSGFTFVLGEVLHGKVEILAGLFGTIGNGLAPNYFQNKILILLPSRVNLVVLLCFASLVYILVRYFKRSWKFLVISLLLLGGGFIFNRFLIEKNVYWYRSRSDYLSGEIGILASIFVTILASLYWKTKKEASLIISLGFLFFVSQILGYFAKYPDTLFSTTHRYLSYASLGFAIFYGGIAMLLGRKYSYVVIGIIVTVNIILGFSYQNSLLAERSSPTRKFYSDLKMSLPSINKGAIFYFDVKSEPLYQNQFREFFSVGSMPDSTAVAIYYGLDRDDIKLITDQNELLYILATTENGLENLHTFYYGDNGLVNTTEQAKKALEGIKTTEIFPGSPLLVRVAVQALPQNISRPDESSMRLLKYLEDKLEFIKHSKATSLSQWRGQEVNYINDGNLETSFRGHRIYWHDHRDEKIVFDIGAIQNINRFIWTNTTNTLTPIEYTINGSRDGKTWSNIYTQKSGQELFAGQRMAISFPETPARFVAMEITKTVSDDSPAISEVEILDTDISDADLKRLPEFLLGPQILYFYPKSAQFLKLELETTTDKGKVTSEKSLLFTNGSNNYSYFIIPGGTKLINHKILSPNQNLSINYKTVEIRNLSLKEIIRLGVIKNYAKN